MRPIAAAAVLACLLAAPAPFGTPVSFAAPAWAGDMGWFYVQRLQEELLLHGYSPGPATGELTARTRLAVAAYRHDAGLPADADLFDVLDHLQYAGPPTLARRRAIGAPDPKIAAVQVMLRRLGYLGSPVDGRASDETSAAVTRFRQECGLGGDGIDEAVLAALREAAARRGTPLPSIVRSLW